MREAHNQPAGVRSTQVGDVGAHSKEWQDIYNSINNPIKNPINNPINAEKRRQEGIKEGVDYLASKGKKDDIMTGEQIAVAKQGVIAVINGLEAAAKANGLEIAVYVGITKQVLKNEDLRWLTQRGQYKANGEFTGQKTRPPLLWASGQQITGSQARTELEFQTVVPFLNSLYTSMPLGLSARSSTSCSMSRNGT